MGLLQILIEVRSLLSTDYNTVSLLKILIEVGSFLSTDSSTMELLAVGLRSESFAFWAARDQEIGPRVLQNLGILAVGLSYFCCAPLIGPWSLPIALVVFLAVFPRVFWSVPLHVQCFFWFAPLFVACFLCSAPELLNSFCSAPREFCSCPGVCL